jgi:acetyl esterase/lipase
MAQPPLPLGPGIEGPREGMKRWESELVEKMGPLDPDLEEFYDVYTLSDGHQSRLKLVRPKDTFSSTTGLPLIVLLHGGGFQVGTVEMMIRPARDFVKRFHAVVVAVSYRLAPEHKVSQQAQDA